MAGVDRVVLENGALRAEFEAGTGALVSLVNTATGWSMNRRAELGLSFRMLAPLPRRRNNPINGEEQACTAAMSEDGRRITFTWERPRSVHGGEIDLTFTGKVTLDDAGLTFDGTVENRSPFTVESVSYPCLGDVPAPGEPLYRLSSAYAGIGKTPLLPRFQNERGYYGVDYPINLAMFPDTPFVLLAGDKQGLYAGCHDTSLKEMIAYICELKPGYEDCVNVGDGFIPEEDEISGQPVHMEFSAVHFPFVNPGETTSLSPIVLNPYQGSWHAGVDCYKAWRTGWFQRPPTPVWATEVHAWQQIHINSPEDELRCRYTELIEHGRACARHGVKAIQLVGWNDGGQDRGNPLHDPDPRLGTREEFRRAIADIEALGVHIILFNKFTWGERSTDWFRQELHRYATKDPYGDAHWYMGYQYQTAVQLSDINTRRFSPMCMQSAAWREIAAREFRKGIDDGASGMLYDECQHHSPARYCFDPDHGHHVPAYVYGGDAALCDTFRKNANPDYLFAGEACYDLEYRHYSITYFRIGDYHHVPIQRYIDPYMGIMAAVTGFNDRNPINQCLLYRYIISYEPYNFKGHLEDFPQTLAYGKLVDALRERYRAYLWDAEYRDTQGATVTPKGTTDMAYSVFRQENGKRAVVVANFSRKETLTATVTLVNTKDSLQQATPEEPEAVACDGRVSVPARSVVVVME